MKHHQHKRECICSRIWKKVLVIICQNAIEVIGKLEINKIEEAFIKLIERHESLRTSFESKDNIIVQKVHKIEDIEFKVKITTVIMKMN